ncbi:hypothetical protein BJ742DRAFT_768543 [Cladochytrium replicatum]|nr:hypothetical protein BJ742DRAFT_768543 [Cladochytrium replicatum]
MREDVLVLYVTVCTTILVAFITLISIILRPLHIAFTTLKLINVRPQSPTRLLSRRDGVDKQLDRKFERRTLGLVDHLFRRQSQEDLARWRALNISDPGFANQWHLKNWVTPDIDLNVTGVSEQGGTGKGVVVCFIDDGVDYEHPDLRDAFFLRRSYDFNDHVKTQCRASVKIVPVLVALEKLQLDPMMFVAWELPTVLVYQAFAFFPGTFPKLMRPHQSTMRFKRTTSIVCLTNGIVNGRGGLGSVFVFATGNGGAFGDNCNLMATPTASIRSRSERWTVRMATRIFLGMLCTDGGCIHQWC